MAPPRNKKKTAYANERVMRPVATHPPPVAKRHFLIERYWIPYSGEYAFSMMERWEVILLHAIALAFIVGLVVAVRAFLPSHLRIVARRAKYYLYGDVTGLGPVPGQEGVW